MWELQVQSLGWEDPLEKEMAAHSSFLAWENPMDRGAWWAAVHGITRIEHDLATKQQQQKSILSKFRILYLVLSISGR